MSGTERLYCTHCTFGSSVLEVNSAENAAKVLGYSVRASSFPATEQGRLREVFRAIERLLSYELPRDAKPSDKEALDASTAPRKLIFLPTVGAFQVVGQLCYRSHDTAGRPGSYFADIIVSHVDVRQPDNSWFPIDCLKLWGAGSDNISVRSWWCDSENGLPEGSGEAGGDPLPPVGPLTDLWQRDGGPLVTDSALYRFLTADFDNSADDEHLTTVIPQRWKKIAIHKRQELFANLLQATLNGRNRGRESVTIAVEPSLAALLFYGVCRVLPPQLTRHTREQPGLSFSTYEPFPERPMTRLVATTFLNEDATNDLPAEVYQRGFACNTFSEVFRYGRIPEAGLFTSYVMSLFREGTDNPFGHIDELLRPLDCLQRLSSATLDVLVQANSQVNQYFGDRPPPQAIDLGVEGNRIRSQRFLDIFEIAIKNGREEWPENLIEKAIEWSGEDLGHKWVESEPVRDLLRSQLPEGADGKKRLETLLQSQASKNSIPKIIAIEFTREVAKKLKRIPSCFDSYLRKQGVDPGESIHELLSTIDDVTREKIFKNSEPTIYGESLLNAAAIPNNNQALVSPDVVLETLNNLLLSKQTSPNHKWTILLESSGLLPQLLQVKYSRHQKQGLDSLFNTLSKSAPSCLASNQRDSAAQAFRDWAEFTTQPNLNKPLVASWQKVHQALAPLLRNAENEYKKTLGRFLYKPSHGDIRGLSEALNSLASSAGRPANKETKVALLKEALRGYGQSPKIKKRVETFVTARFKAKPKDASVQTQIASTPESGWRSKKYAAALAGALCLILLASFFPYPFPQEQVGPNPAGENQTAGRGPSPQTLEAAGENMTAASVAPPAIATDNDAEPKKETNEPKGKQGNPALPTPDIGLELVLKEDGLFAVWNEESLQNSTIRLAVSINNEK